MTTLREQAAMVAMAQLLCKGANEREFIVTTARISVAYADALFAELERSAPKPSADATRLTCTAAERELIETVLGSANSWKDGAPGMVRVATLSVLAERRAAKETKQ